MPKRKNSFNSEKSKKLKKSESIESSSEEKTQWMYDEYLAKAENIEVSTARNIIKLLDEENTIPFITRYRKNLIGKLEPDDLRRIKDLYDYIKKVRLKQEQLIKKISNTNECSDVIIRAIKKAQTLEELEFLNAPYKQDSKGSLAQRAKALNLEQPAKLILQGHTVINLESYLKTDCKGLENENQIKLGIQHIIADMISKKPEVQLYIQKIVESGSAIIQAQANKQSIEGNMKSHKYDTYANFSQTVANVKPHQVLAINRGETEKLLSVKIEIPVEAWLPLRNYCKKNILEVGCKYDLRRFVIINSLDDAIKRLLGPLAQRRVKAKLKKEAEEESIRVFGANLRQLLLTPPLRDKVIMGIDPGFRHGCKVAIISEMGVPLAWTTFFLPNSNTNNKAKKSCENTLVDLLLKYQCEVIALGNGKGCRETEAIIGNLIEKKAFKPYNVSYTIISEQGVSIYSCSPEALEEFPDLDALFVGAISLARRLQDPLSELVKVEPKHLGIGLYQHDMKNKRLTSTLNEIVSECVSFVGINVNTASFHLLKHVAGLNVSKAKEIIAYRSKNDGFQTVEELKKVKGISNKTFIQCAGFFRITFSKERQSNPLDQTSIHPESYSTALKLAKKIEVNLNEIGSKKFIDSVHNKLNQIDINTLAKKFEVSEFDIQFILDIFKHPLDQDLRNLYSGPVFRKEIIKIEELKEGQKVTGTVMNIVPFGAFIDIGVGIDGLIHSSKMNKKTLALNNKVVVKVLNVDMIRKRISLELKEICDNS